MEGAEPSQPKPSDEPPSALPLSLPTPPGEDALAGLRLELELRKHRMDVECQLEVIRLRHRYRQRQLAIIANFLLRSLALAGGIALFPFHYPGAGALLLGVALNLFTKSELKRLLRAVTKAYLGGKE